MRRRAGRDRQARLQQFYETLSPMQRGVAICILLGNALLVVTIDGLVVVAVIHGAVDSWRHRSLGPVAAIRMGMGVPLRGAVAAIAIQWVVARGLMRAVDTGRAAAWLERSERWLSASASHADARVCRLL